jgi:hypothetical protein
MIVGEVLTIDASAGLRPGRRSICPHISTNNDSAKLGTHRVAGSIASWVVVKGGDRGIALSPAEAPRSGGLSSGLRSPAGFAPCARSAFTMSSLCDRRSFVSAKASADCGPIGSFGSARSCSSTSWTDFALSLAIANIRVHSGIADEVEARESREDFGRIVGNTEGRGTGLRVKVRSGSSFSDALSEAGMFGCLGGQLVLRPCLMLSSVLRWGKLRHVST